VKKHRRCLRSNTVGSFAVNQIEPGEFKAYCSSALRVNRLTNKKHLNNVGPIHHCEPPHAHSADVASGTVARRLRIDVDDNDNDNA